MASDDAALWRQVADSTAPLPGRGTGPAARAAPAAPIATDMPKLEEIEPPNSAGASANAPPAARRTALPPLASGAAPGVDQRTAMRLRRGQLPIDARVDLHGLTQEEGIRTFSLFIEDASESGARCVLAITGKGSRSRGAPGDGSIGVLREALPRWINRPALRPLILAFCPARPKDGGEGAFYILLKRRR